MSFLLVLLVAASPAVDEHIAMGREAMANLEFGVAAHELTIAASDRTATDDQRMEANLLAGIANVIVGSDALARLNFRYVLLRDPNAALPEGTPQKVVSFFELVRMEMAAERVLPPQSKAVPSDPSPPAATAPGSSILPFVIAGAGGLLVVGGGGLAAWSELSLDDPSHPVDEKNELLLAGRVGLVLGGAGVMLVGGALLMSVLD